MQNLKKFSLSKAIFNNSPFLVFTTQSPIAKLLILYKFRNTEIARKLGSYLWNKLSPLEKAFLNSVIEEDLTPILEYRSSHAFVNCIKWWTILNFLKLYKTHKSIFTNPITFSDVKMNKPESNPFKKNASSLITIFLNSTDYLLTAATRLALHNIFDQVIKITPSLLPKLSSRKLADIARAIGVWLSSAHSHHIAHFNKAFSIAKNLLKIFINSRDRRVGTNAIESLIMLLDSNVLSEEDKAEFAKILKNSSSTHHRFNMAKAVFLWMLKDLQAFKVAKRLMEGDPKERQTFEMLKSLINLDRL